MLGAATQTQTSPVIQQQKKTLSCISALVFLAADVHQPDPGSQLTHVRAGRWHSEVLFLSFLTEENVSNTRIASLSSKDCNPYKTLCWHPCDALNLHFLQLFIWPSADLVENAEETGVYA